jgi:hypothetical protein
MGAILALFCPSPVRAASPDFTVLAGTAVTCTDSTVEGDIGVYPGTAVTETNCTVSGAVSQGDAVAQVASEDFLVEYDRLAALGCDAVLTTLDGQTLSPGTYCVDAAATSTGSVLTLAGVSTDTWIFKIGTLGTGAHWHQLRGGAVGWGRSLRRDLVGRRGGDDDEFSVSGVDLRRGRDHRHGWQLHGRCLRPGGGHVDRGHGRRL